MKPALPMTSNQTASSSSFRPTYCALRSRSGIPMRVCSLRLVEPPPAAATKRSLLVLEQLVVGNVLDDLGGHAHHELARGDVTRDDRPGGYEGLLADLDARQLSLIHI